MKDIFSSIKSYFISIKDNFYLLAMLLLVTFFSSLNIANGLDFSVTDTSAANAIATFHEEEEKAEAVENKVTAQLATIKTPSTTTKTVKNYITITGNTVALRPTNCETMPTPNYSSANYCYFRGSSNLFIYGHNTNDIFGKIQNLGVGSTFTITFNGQTSTYKIVNKFSDTVTNLNSNSNLRSSIYGGYYRGNSDITIQTCYGTGDSERLYIKANHI